MVLIHVHFRPDLNCACAIRNHQKYNAPPHILIDTTTIRKKPQLLATNVEKCVKPLLVKSDQQKTGKLNTYVMTAPMKNLDGVLQHIFGVIINV
jgi:hypothetical protein